MVYYKGEGMVREGEEEEREREREEGRGREKCTITFLSFHLTLDLIAS